MAKGWVSLNPVEKNKRTDAEKARRDKSWDKLIRNTKSLSVAEMKKASREAYEAQKDYENQLIQAYVDKRLKSKDKIAEARQLIKARKEAEAKKKEKNASQAA